MAMYDTIHLWLSVDQARGVDINNVSKRLSGFTEHHKEDGSVCISVTLGNTFKVNISERGVSLRGSLAKYYLYDNLHTLTRSDSARAIEKMSDDLCLPVDRAKVTRIDFAHNFLMRYEPEVYYPYLGDCQYYQRFSQPRSVYWSNGNRTKLVYDKVEEAKKKGVALPDVWRDQNVLRYELRFIRRLSNDLQQPYITASTLTDEKFYMVLVRRWIAEYEAIHKLNKINLNLKNMNSPKDFFRLMAFTKIVEIGQNTAMELVEEMRAKGAFEKPEYYSRLKREIRDICKSPELTEPSDLITELDKKISNVGRHFR
ncbi:MAG: hypothetical protein IPL46_02755 [Saprospiraceae bacterium]|nr:hypothetical protein [Saprospiraceae bacterium]